MLQCLGWSGGSVRGFSPQGFLRGARRGTRPTPDPRADKPTMKNKPTMKIDVVTRNQRWKAKREQEDFEIDAEGLRALDTSLRIAAAMLEAGEIADDEMQRFRVSAEIARGRAKTVEKVLCDLLV